MNHFERLIARALAHPAGESGRRFLDPFEASAPWPLDEVVATLARTETPLQPAPPAAPAAPTVAPPTVIASPIPSPATLDALPTTTAAMPREAAPPAAAVAPTPAHATPPVAPSRSAPPATREPSPLAAADRFMSALGVRVPDAVSAAASVEPTPPAPPVALAQPRRAPARSDALPQQVSPPPAPTLAPPRARSIAGTDAAAPAARDDAGEPDRRDPQRSPSVVETRHVIVVERPATERSARTIATAGAPHFGLGQL